MEHTGAMNNSTHVSSIEGRWRLRVNVSEWLDITIARDPRTEIAHDQQILAPWTWDTADVFQGILYAGQEATAKLDQITWEPRSGRWEFRYQDLRGLDGWQWFRGTVVDGIFVGRCTGFDSHMEQHPDLSAYRLHVTGWHHALDQESAARTYRIISGSRGQHLACLRLDRDEQGQPLGRLKVCATRMEEAPDQWDARGEEAEYDLEIIHWDDERLEFIRHGSDWMEIYRGQADAQTISGVCTRSTTAATEIFTWEGSRAEILGYGLAARSAAQRQQWQERMRRRLAHLTMAGNPAPLSVNVHVLNKGVQPLPGISAAPHSRDDDPEHWPQAYTKTELLFAYTLPNPYGPGTIARQLHAWLAVPTVAPLDRQGYRAVLAFNGHGSAARGSGAWAMLDAADDLYWYGDAFARRGFVVLALDISHRPLEDRSALYRDHTLGSDPLHGNGPRPAIAAPQFPHDSDWEEDGERVWDAMRTLDILLSGQLDVQVNPRRILVTGLSLGGEIATIMGALDPHISLVISAGFAPDMQVMKYHGNHPCWQWMHADILEYLNTSDWHALIAPRPLLVETGLVDTTFSSFQPPFAADKQIMRRSKEIYGIESKYLIHYLHDAQPGELTHQYRVGDRLSTRPELPPAGIAVPVAIAPSPDEPWSRAWQSDGRTTVPPLGGVQIPTLFDYIDHFWQD